MNRLVYFNFPCAVFNSPIIVVLVGIHIYLKRVKQRLFNVLGFPIVSAPHCTLAWVHVKPAISAIIV